MSYLDLVPKNTNQPTNLAQMVVDIDWPCNILQIDKAHFCLIEQVNTLNFWIRAVENPYAILEQPSHPEKW